MSSVLQYPEKKSCNEVQIWNNAVFDNGDGYNHHSPKENQNPNSKKSPVYSKEKDLDSEIEKIEKEITRLSIRLESLRLEKAKRSLKMVEKRGRVVAAKFKEQPPKQSVDEFRTPRRGSSVGPTEIMGGRRGVSIGPSEIHSGCKEKGAVPNRRKSCYWKMEGIDELRETKEKRKSLSVSPRSRLKSGGKMECVSTSWVRKTMKKDEGVVQPKKLFVKEEKKPLKSGRVVPSRYNVGSNGGGLGNKEVKKRSLNGGEDEEGKRVKKKWEVPSGVGYKTPLSVSKMLDRVPKIRTLKVVNESPRDSGAAKRVSELVGRRSFFHLSDGDDGGNEGFEGSKIGILGCVDESCGVSQVVGSKSLFDHGDDDEMPVFSFEEEED